MRESSSNYEDCKATLNSQLKDKFRDGDKEKIEKAVQDILGLVRQEPEAEKYRNEDETNKAKIKAKNSLENYFSPRKTPTQRKSSITSSHEDKVEMQGATRKLNSMTSRVEEVS